MWRALLMGTGITSAALYSASLFMPAFVCSSKGFLGHQVLAYGWLGLIYGDPRWFANALYLWILLGLFRPAVSIPFWAPVLATGLALASIPFPSAGCASVAGAFVFSERLANGGSLWIVAVVLAAAVALIRSAARLASSPTRKRA